MTFKEIEHKFVVNENFDLYRFRMALEGLEPKKHVTLRVRDRYFLTESGRARRFVLRHRFDLELHELTLKSLEEDAEMRDEINLKLEAGDQQAQVDAFIAAQGVVWKGALWKDLEVWHFPDCEVVHYVATADVRTVRCVEFEAKLQSTPEAALAVLKRYELASGFANATRTPESLLALLWPDALRHTLGA